MGEPHKFSCALCYGHFYSGQHQNSGSTPQRDIHQPIRRTLQAASASPSSLPAVLRYLESGMGVVITIMEYYKIILPLILTLVNHHV